MDRLKNLFSQIVDLMKRGIKLFGDNEMLAKPVLGGFEQ